MNVVDTPVSNPPQPRATQSFVHTLTRTKARPSLTLLEIAWRWAFGIPALLIVYVEAARVLATTSFAGTGLEQLTFTDPMGAAESLSLAASRLMPAVSATALWLVPALAVFWCAACSIGRAIVLARMTAKPQPRTLTVFFLHLIRLAALGGSFAVWFLLLRLASRTAIWNPMLAGGEPDLVLYFAIAIVASLGLFTLWGIVSWLFATAPLLASLEDLSLAASLRAAATRRSLRSPMVEINLVMGIVKIALIVLAMVMSATPLPFESIATPAFMHLWYAATAVAYILASDFFHVARLFAYVEYISPSASLRS